MLLNQGIQGFDAHSVGWLITEHFIAACPWIWKKINKNAHFDQRAKIALSWFQREIDLGWQFALN